MPKIIKEGHYTCNVRVEYEWKPPRCSSCKVFGHIHKECPKNTCAGEKKTVKKPSQTSRGVPVGPKMAFKPQKEYPPVTKKPNASSSGNKKKGVEPTIEVSNSNPFDVLNSVNNDVEFGTNGGTTNLVNNEATSIGSSFMNIDNDGEIARLGSTSGIRAFALRNFNLEVMEFESAHSNTTAKYEGNGIHEDDLEAMDLKWQLFLLSMRAKRYFQRTCKKIFINVNDTVGYDKSKVECFKCHKMGHFARECRAPRNKEGQFKNQDNTRKHRNNEDISSKAMLAIDGEGFDWSDMAEEQAQTNLALMVFLDSEVYNNKSCTKTCLKYFETLKKQYDDLIVKLNQTEAATYKRGLTIVEEQHVTYRKNEVLFSEEVSVLKREVTCKDYDISVLKTEFEKVKQEKEGIEFKIKIFHNASKSLDKLLGSQITDRSKKGLGYNVLPPPHPLIYNGPKKLDLSYSGLDEFKDPKFKSYGSKD
ncbi:ribonuclease H-like domain-containing protein, partial [Tanacetum coccineum]